MQQMHSEAHRAYSSGLGSCPVPAWLHARATTTTAGRLTVALRFHSLQASHPEVLMLGRRWGAERVPACAASCSMSRLTTGEQLNRGASSSSTGWMPPRPTTGQARTATADAGYAYPRCMAGWNGAASIRSSRLRPSRLGAPSRCAAFSMMRSTTLPSACVAASSGPASASPTGGSSTRKHVTAPDATSPRSVFPGRSNKAVVIKGSRLRRDRCPCRAPRVGYQRSRRPP